MSHQTNGTLIDRIEKAEQKIRSLEGKMGVDFPASMIKQLIEEEIGEKIWN